MYQLPDEKDKRKLVVFSDSREDAAQVANGIERNHFTDLQRELLTKIFNKGLKLKMDILSAVQTGNQQEIDYFSAQYPDIYYHFEDLFDKSNYNGPNPIKQGEKEKALREIQRLNDCIFPVEEIVLSSEDNSLLKIEKFGLE